MTFESSACFCCLLLTLGLAIFPVAKAAEAMAAPTTVIEERDQILDWSPLHRVSTSFAVDSEAPALAVTDGGTTHVVWEENDELYHSHRIDGAWSTPSRIRGTGSGEQPALASGSDDQVHLVYVNASDIFYVSWNGSTWGLSRNVSQTTGVSDSPDLAVAPDNSIHVVALEQLGSDKALYCASSDDGSAWPVYTPVPSAYGEGPSIDVMGTPDATAQIAYRESVVADVYTVQRIGGTWTVPEAVTTTPATFSTAPKLILDASGKAHIVWRETIGDTPQVQYARGPTWTPVITLSRSNAGATLPALGLGRQGSIHAAWGEGAYPSFSLLHTWSSDAASWQQPEMIHAGSLQLDDVALFAATNGAMHAAWVEGSIGEIWHTSWMRHRAILPLVLKD
jgi:hypothetical protein